MTAMQSLNGKKMPIAFIAFILTTAIGYGMVKADVKNNKEAIVALKEEPIKIARLEQDVVSVKSDVTEIKLEQREIRQDIKQILRAVTK